MGGYQLTLIILMTMELSILLTKHGQPRKDNYSFWYSAFGWGLLLFLLIKGGFFS